MKGLITDVSIILLGACVFLVGVAMICFGLFGGEFKMKINFPWW